MENIENILKNIRDFGLYPDISLISGSPTSLEVVANGKKVLIFCSNDYLGLANSELLKKAAKEAIDKYGVGSGGSRLVSGNTDIQVELEKAIADFKNSKSAITFSTGYMANTGTIPAVMDAVSGLHKIAGRLIPAPFQGKRIILSDELNHASIIDGCRLSHAQIVVYKHKDMKDLEGKLKKLKKIRKMIVTDGVFSMDGDIAPLPGIVELAKKYNSIVMVDDAHASGVLGKNGRGTAEHFGLDENDIDITMGTFTKSFGGVGGFVCGTKALIDYLRISARSYIFSAPIPPSIAAALIAAVKEAKNNHSLRENLWSNVSYLKTNLTKSGFDTLNSETQIIPVLIGKEEKAIEFSKKLLENGILAPCVRWPAVPWGKARLRLTVKATHTKEQIDCLIDLMIKLKNNLKGD
ncbi:MAG: 8-amino-7-oxononanoate synthase [Candidatus Omnitrophota bacterium]|jgi:8-amino-7-oxononanoate synthase|nr:MAG: 8-amino-7-oxononanoate synthase [Candidatus Omnitrophota bacterium]